MGKSEKKFGKGRLDHYYRLAKERGYRARSSFKIIQLNQKYGFFNTKKKGKPMCVIDLCAAPGSWCQVATECLPLNSLIVGVDLAPIKPLPNVISFQSDITTEHCRSQLRGYLKTWKADVVMHDGAPNVGMAWAQDAYTQSELVLQSLKLAVEFLNPGGWFVTKVFRSKDYNKLMWVFNQFFDKCEATKPPSSRNVSAEIFVVCRGFKAPAKIDPRLLDPLYVFEELQESNQNNQQKVYNPEKKTRKRDGYNNDEGKLILAQKTSALDFVKTDDPITMLGEHTEFTFDKNDPEMKDIRRLPQTTSDVIEFFKDLKVLGKKDFRTLLKWRKACRKLLKLDEKEPEPVVEDPYANLTTEELIDKELEDLTDAQKKRIKKEKRRRHEQRQKELLRLRMEQGNAGDIIAESYANNDELFDFNKVAKSGEAEMLAKGKQQPPILRSSGPSDIVLGDDDDVMLDDMPSSSSGEEEEPQDEILSDSDAEDEHLATQLDNMYESFKEQQAKSAQARALRNRETEWHGIESDQEDSDLEGGLEDENNATLSSRASMFFDNPDFNLNVASDTDDSNADSESDSDGSDINEPVTPATTESESNDEDEDQQVKTSSQVYKEGDRNELDESIKMTLAQQLALGKITKQDLINEGYNKVSFRDTENLPQWFLEDEAKNTRFMKPITKEAALAAKEAAKALNARPIKKVQEAKSRKKMRAQRRLERIRKKSDLINEDSSISEREKNEQIAQLMRRAKQNTRPKVTVVRAYGKNRGLSGRPGGVRGKYKMVDGTMKKEQRALKRIAKKHKK